MEVNGSTLKWIAMVSMVIDHIAAVVLMPAFGISGMFHFSTLLHADGITWFCHGMRFIGRLAFPIFCFLLVEGLVHTHSRKHYLFNLVILALVSEVPFDLCLRGNAVNFDVQNTIWTLVLGFIACHLMDWCDKRFSYNKAITVKMLAIAGFMIAAYMLHTDYDAFGIGLIVLLYMLRENRKEQCLVGGLVCAYEITAPLAFVPIYFYNGRRGHQWKWFFYIFYPTHLLLLYLIRVAWIGW